MTLASAPIGASGAEGLATVAMPTIGWSMGSGGELGGSAAGQRLSTRRRVNADLVATRDVSGIDEGTVRVPVVFDSRTVIGGLASLSGSDASGTLRVRFSATPKGEGRINITLDPPSTATPRSILCVLNLMDELAGGATFGVWFHATDDWAVPPAPATDAPRIPNHYRRAVEAVAQLQASSGVEFPMPEEINERTAQGVAQALSLLSGSEVRSRWTHAEIELSSRDTEEAAFTEGATYGVTTDIAYGIDIGEERLDLGLVQADFAKAKIVSVRPSAEGTSDVRIEFTPDDDDMVTLSMVERSNFDPFDRLDPVVIRVEALGDGQRLGSLLAE